MDRSISEAAREPEIGTLARDHEHDERQAPARARTVEDSARLRQQIDAATQDRPTFSQFVDRLDRLGIRVIPSLQKTGRLNGLSYEVEGTRVKGSDLGRAYSAHGLSQHKYLNYEAERDLGRARELVERARQRHATLERKPPDREERIRHDDGLTPSQRATMKEIGRFRTLLVADVVRIHYRGNNDAWRRDSKPLARQGLLEERSVVITTHTKNERAVTRSLSIVVLTKKGRDLLKRTDKDTKATHQALYAGFVKSREIAHDAAIYRMYHAEAAHIEKEGGRIKRVVLDFELKRKAYSPLAKARAISLEEFHRKQAEIAEEQGLKVVEGKIRLPDLRIEYDTATGDATRVDLELATEHYRGEHMSAKSQAGFKIYAEGASFPPGGSFGRSAVIDDHEIEIFSF